MGSGQAATDGIAVGMGVAKQCGPFVLPHPLQFVRAPPPMQGLAMEKIITRALTAREVIAQ